MRGPALTDIVLADKDRTVHLPALDEDHPAVEHPFGGPIQYSYVRSDMRICFSCWPVEIDDNVPLLLDNRDGKVHKITGPEGTIGHELPAQEGNNASSFRQRDPLVWVKWRFLDPTSVEVCRECDW